MTVSEDLNFGENLDGEEATAAYPVVFGISFTPLVSGILIGALGALGAGCMLLYMVMPAWESFQQQQTKQNDLQGQIDQKKASINQIDKVKQDLAQAKQQQIQVLSLFSNEKTLDTLLLDLNRLVESGNAQLPANAVKAKLKKFAPASKPAEIVTDNSLGTQVNGKLKRSSINIEFIGTYEQTQSILRNMERLQPLLIVKDYQSTLAPPETAEQGKVVRRQGPVAITTSFQLQALMPLNSKDIADAAKAAEPKK